MSDQFPLEAAYQLLKSQMETRYGPELVAKIDGIIRGKVREFLRTHSPSEFTTAVAQQISRDAVAEATKTND